MDECGQSKRGLGRKWTQPKAEMAKLEAVLDVKLGPRAIAPNLLLGSGPSVGGSGPSLHKRGPSIEASVVQVRYVSFRFFSSLLYLLFFLSMYVFFFLLDVQVCFFLSYISFLFYVCFSFFLSHIFYPFFLLTPTQRSCTFFHLIFLYLFFP